MPLPKAAQAALERAEQIEQELQAPPPSDPTPAPPPAEEPPAPAPAPAPEPPPPAPAENWEQKYRSLQGKYDAEVPSLQAQIRTLTGQVAELTAKVQTPPKPADPPPAAPEPPPKLVTDKDVENFGPDVIDLIARKAQEIVAEQTGKLTGELQALRAENAKLAAQVEGTAETASKAAYTGFIGEVRKRVPDLDTLDQNQSWLDWCMGVDPLSGSQRQLLLNDALTKGDLERTVAFIDTWRKTQPANPDPTPPAKDPAVEAELRSQLEPGTSKTPPAPAPEPSSITASDIAKFYDDVTKGKYRGRDQERLAREAEIDKAIAEGRVR